MEITMKLYTLIVIVVAALILGAVAHEKDMARNFSRDGDAHAWFNEIQINY